MARNKYPEVTVEKILEVSRRLFLEKGYDNTTIQDIVNELGGLTKGAVYHHFRSKEEIMDALSDIMFQKNNPFETVRRRADLNGLEKLRLAIRLNQADDQQVELTRQAIPMLKNPHILARMIDSNRRILCPRWRELIEEGVRDESIHTEYPEELAELMVLLDLWMVPSVFPADGEGIRRRNLFIADALEKLGLPLFDREMREMLEKVPYFSEQP